jgi:hypothetical protein
LNSARVATQRALSENVSRIAIDFPRTLDFGLESRTDEDDPAAASSRELAYIYKEMFKPLVTDANPNALSVCFSSPALSKTASAMWADSPDYNVISLEHDPSAKHAEETDRSMGGLLPRLTQAVIFVSPTSADMLRIAKVSKSLGDRVLMVLLNSCVDEDEDDGRTVGGFESAFSMRVHEAIAGLELYEYGSGSTVGKLESPNDVFSCRRVLGTRRADDGRYTNGEIESIVRQAPP